MRSKYLKNRFNTSKEELERLGSEFITQALPSLEKLYKTTFWILPDKKSTNKIIKQVFFEAIEDCDITKNDADWQSWIERICMREILDFYSEKENDRNTDFGFIDNFEVNVNKFRTILNSDTTSKINFELLVSMDLIFSSLITSARDCKLDNKPDNNIISIFSSVRNSIYFGNPDSSMTINPLIAL